MKKLKFIWIVLLAAFINKAEGQVVISEVMPDNESVFDAELNETPDWIEIKNTSENVINLGGFFLSDDKDIPDKWEFPAYELQSGEYVIILCSGDEGIEAPNYMQANFKLKKQGETLLISDQNLEPLTSLTYTCVPSDRTYGIDEEGNFTHFYVSSPGYENNYSTSFYQLSDSISLSHEAGLYEEPFQLDVLSIEDQEIKFTTNGVIPSESSMTWNVPKLINENYITEGLSYIPSATDWDEPLGSVFKGETLKFLTFKNGCPSSTLVHADYYVRENIDLIYPYPVYSLTFDKEEFFGDNGIMVPGITGSNYLGDGEEWERRGQLQLMKAYEGVLLDKEIDVRIRGRGSRNNRQKSLKLYGRDENGKASFNYQFFRERDITDYRRIVLRSGHSDFTKSMLKDILSAELVEKMNVDYMESETSVVFMNGEYWGIQNARENMGKFYLESLYGVNPEELDIIKFQENELEALEGSTDDFESLIRFSQNNDLSIAENYLRVLDQIELTNFIDYHIAELFFANWDWPETNQKVWKTHEPGAKFRWMFYDCDACFYIQSLDRLTNLIQQKNEPSYSFQLFYSLLENKNFRDQFHSRYLELISKDLSSRKMLNALDSLENLYEPIILEHLNRWQTPDTYSSWLESLSEMRVFAAQRPTIVFSQLEELFGNPISVYPNPAENELFLKSTIDLETQVQVFDSRGKLMGEAKLEEGVPLQVEHLSSGVYLLKIQIGEFLFTKKFIKR